MTGRPDPSERWGDNIFGFEDPYSAWADTPDVELPDQVLAARRAAEAVRRLIERLAGTSAGVEELQQMAAEVDAVTAGMPVGDGPDDRELMAEASLAVEQANRLVERSPFVGRANPIAPPLRLSLVDGAIESSVTFGASYEGPPGCVHGGYIAGIFDEVLGAAQSLSGRAGMTGRLTVHYRSPTPLDTELSLRGELVSAEGRKLLCRGTLHAGDRLCAEAEGLFITIDPDRVRAMLAARDAERAAGDA